MTVPKLDEPANSAIIQPPTVNSIKPAVSATAPDRADPTQQRNVGRAADAEDGAGQQRVGLAGARAEIGAEDRVREVDADAERGDAHGSGQREAGVMDLRADEQEREAG